MTRRPGGFCPTSEPLVRLESSQNSRVGCVLDAHGGNTVMRSSCPQCYQHEWQSSDIDDYEASCELLTSVDRSNWVLFNALNNTDGVAEPTVWTLSFGVVDSETGSELAKALYQVRYWISVKYTKTIDFSTKYREEKMVAKIIAPSQDVPKETGPQYLKRSSRYKRRRATRTKKAEGCMGTVLLLQLGVASYHRGEPILLAFHSPRKVTRRYILQRQGR